MCSERTRWRKGFVMLDRCPAGLPDGPQPGGGPRLAVGDGLAVASAIGTLGQVLAEPLDFANNGLPLVSVSSDGVDGNVGSGGVEDEGDRLAFVIPAGKASARGPSLSHQASLRQARSCLTRSWNSASVTSARSI
jgi:hypothetical protein